MDIFKRKGKEKGREGRRKKGREEGRKEGKERRRKVGKVKDRKGSMLTYAPIFFQTYTHIFQDGSGLKCAAYSYKTFRKNRRKSLEV